jgi:hypothetical protein
MNVHCVFCDLKIEFLFGRKISFNLQCTNMKSVCVLYAHVISVWCDSQSGHYFLNQYYRLVFVMEFMCGYCRVRTGLNIMHKMLKLYTKVYSFPDLKLAKSMTT